ncbi:MAG TPA: hypothetical protein VGC76_14160 [Pyrinomonadaceae bacterium]|jgi:hypothetical protein
MRDKTGVRWLRVIIAGLLSEILIILVIVGAIMIYKYGVTPLGEQLDVFSAKVGFYVGIAGSAAACFLLAWWAGRVLKSDFIVNGLLVGVFAILWQLGLTLSAGAKFETIYLLAYALKLAGGALGGLVARRRFTQTAIMS